MQFRTNIREISRRRQPSTVDEKDSKKALLEECDEYRSQMKYLGVEIKVRPSAADMHRAAHRSHSRTGIKDRRGYLKNEHAAHCVVFSFAQRIKGTR